MHTQRTEPLSDRYGINVPDEVLDELPAALHGPDDLEDRISRDTAEVTVRLDRILDELTGHLPVEVQLAFSKELFRLDES